MLQYYLFQLQKVILCPESISFSVADGQQLQRHQGVKLTDVQTGEEVSGGHVHGFVSTTDQEFVD